MVFLIAPEQFNPRFEVVSCFLEYDGEILLLQRQDYKPEGGTWGVPAGKINEGETPNLAILREIFQEVGLNVSEEEMSYFQRVFVRYPNYDFIYHIYHLQLRNKPVVKINPEEHKAFKWVSPANALEINLILDLDACIKMFYKI